MQKKIVVNQLPMVMEREKEKEKEKVVVRNRLTTSLHCKVQVIVLAVLLAEMRMMIQ